MYESTKDAAKKDFKNTAEDVKDNIREGAQKAKGEIADFAEKTGRKANAALNKASDSLASARDAVSGTINDHPVPATGVALLAGLAIGFLIARR